MRLLVRLPLCLLAALAVSSGLGACGSVVDPTGGGGAGGHGGDGGGSACKSFPSAHGYLISCGSSQAAGGNDPILCSECRKDEGDNKFRADCVDASCTCTYSPGNGKPDIGCSCTMTAACKVTFPSCCPQLD